MYLGIDLGTTFSVGAYIDADGHAQAIRNAEGHTITPSVVYYEKPGSVIVGDIAKRSSKMYPKNVISLVKNSMGKKTTFVTDYGEFTPEVVSSEILKKIVRDANKALGSREPITDVVVTIPAYFSDRQRAATKDAIKIAGLNCLGLVNEPTAAAYFYASNARMDNANLLIYDLGGGTFDVTVVKVKGEDIKVLSTRGLDDIGGSTYDKAIADHVTAEIKAKHGLDLTAPEYAEDYQELLVNAEAAKIELSASSRTIISVRAGTVRENVELTRETFDEMIAPKYMKSERQLKVAVKDAGLTLKDINKVILAGGSSRIPYIEEHLKELFGIQPSHEVNPDEVVALGAALYARSLEGQKGGSRIIDVCSHGIGITALEEDRSGEYNDILIKRNSSLPAEAHKLYKLGADDQSELAVTVNEGDFREVSDVTEICTVNVSLPAKLKKGTQIDIRIGLDRDQLLHVYLRLPNNGNVEREVTFNRRANMTDTQISEWKKIVANNTDGLQKPDPKKEEETERGGLRSFVGKLFNTGDNKSGEKPAPESSPKEEKKDKLPKIIETSTEGLVGFMSVKIALRNYYGRIEASKKRALTGAKDSNNRNFIIYGAHGMGRTTAAMTVANTLTKLGSANDHLVSVCFDDLDGPDEATVKANIETKIQEAMGGVLLLDDFDEEFVDTNMSAPGPQLVDLLFKAYQAAGANLAIIVVGDGKEFDDMRKKKRRFSELFTGNEIRLEGFAPEEYVKILHSIAEEMSYVVDEEADSLLEKYFKDEMRLPDFDYIHRIRAVLRDAITDSSTRALSKRHLKQQELMIIRRENFRLNSGGQTLDELLDELNSLTGLAEVKKEIHALVSRLQVRKRAEQNGQKLPNASRNLHMIFMGHAGTGKTTVARILGGIFRELEILPRGHVVEVTRSKIVSEYVGKTAIQMSERCDEAMGGILFIDEAYDLCRGDNDTFGKEAVNALVPEIENRRNDMVVILAGYTDDMNEFLKNNEGLSSRFPNKIMFADYTIDEMMTIFEGNCKKDGYMLEDGMKPAVKAVLAERARTEDNFGNARGVRNLYEAIVANQQVRLAEIPDLTDEDLVTLRKADIGTELVAVEHPKTVDELLAELNSMIGLSSVKNQVNIFVAGVQMDAKRKAAGLKTSGVGTLHMVFKGNPGTGKTTVARLIGSIMKGLGILPKGHVVECDRNMLVAGYVGQTAPQTTKMVMSAMGGVLFIDEAYTLTSSHGSNDFGQEAVDTLMKLMEDYRGQFMCIVAGYTREMDDFIASNPGLERRFPNVIVFEDYSLDEMCDIFKSMAASGGLKLGEGVMEAARELIRKKSTSPTFGNAGGVRNILDKAKAAMNRRLFTQGSGSDPEELVTLTADDIKQVQ